MRAAMVSAFQGSGNGGTKSMDDSRSFISDEADAAGLAGLEPHRRSGGDIEAKTARLLALESERRIGLVEMIMRADLDRPVAGIGDIERHRRPTGVDLDVAR